MVYLGIGDRTVLRFVEIKALREIKLSLDVAGKQKVTKQSFLRINLLRYASSVIFLTLKGNL